VPIARRSIIGASALSERAARSAIADEILTVHEEIMPLRLGDLFSRSNPPYLKDQFVPRYAGWRRQGR
jgi:hypothetical protein